MQCRGITQSGSVCRLSAVGSDCYCSRHSLSKAPMTPTAVGWPSTKGISRWAVFRQHNFRYRAWLQTNVPGLDFGALRTDQFLLATLILLHDRQLASEMQPLVDACLAHMAQFPHLAHYREYFGRELSVQYREAARRRLVSFYFTRCQDLCDDVIEKVLESV
jgi:hypothetical protein